jgi:hypothetical protein
MNRKRPCGSFTDWPASASIRKRSPPSPPCMSAVRSRSAAWCAPTRRRLRHRLLLPHRIPLQQFLLLTLNPKPQRPQQPRGPASIRLRRPRGSNRERPAASFELGAPPAIKFCPWSEVVSRPSRRSGTFAFPSQYRWLAARGSRLEAPSSRYRSALDSYND